MANLPVATFFALQSMRQQFGWDDEPAWRRDPRILRQQRAEEQLKRVEYEQQVLREALRGVPSRRQLAAAGLRERRRWFGLGRRHVAVASTDAGVRECTPAGR